MRIVADQRLILGPPGCGKTTRCLDIVEKELEAGVPPNKIAVVSFTKKAVEEAVERASARFNYRPSDLPYFRTLHSLCYQVLGLRRNDVMQKAHYADVGTALGYTFGARELNPEDGYPTGGTEGDRLLFVSGLARNRLVSLEDQWHEINDNEIDIFALRRLHMGLQQYKQDTGLMDFTDMLEIIVREQRTVPVRVVIIDEAQDLTNLQWAVCATLFRGAERVYIAGDDDQALYKWAGADVEKFLSLEGQRETLAKSYRLPASVYNVANRVINQVGHRFDKQWAPRDDEGSVQRLPNVELIDFSQPGSWLILARNAYMLSDTEDLLRRSGLLFRTRREESSVTWEHYVAIRTWERLRRGQREPGSAVRVLYEHLRPGTTIQRGFKGTAKIEDAQEYTMQEARDVLGITAQGEWHDALDGINAATREYYRTVLRAGRKLNDAPNIRVGTIHSSKGGEADNVALMLDMSYRTFQGYQRFPDDEHRVFYVGCTRARKDLYLLDAQSPQGFTV